MRRLTSLSSIISAVSRLFFTRQRERKQSIKPTTSPKWMRRNGSLRTVIPYDEKFVEQMKQLARVGDGGVTVYESAGRRSLPKAYKITPLDYPSSLKLGPSIVSALVLIENIRYEFHVWVHPNSYSDFQLIFYFVVTGPSQKTLQNEEFQITEAFRWTGERPWAPLLVKHVLREWSKRPEVLSAIDAAKKSVPPSPLRPSRH